MLRRTERGGRKGVKGPSDKLEGFAGKVVTNHVRVAVSHQEKAKHNNGGQQSATQPCLLMEQRVQVTHTHTHKHTHKHTQKKKTHTLCQKS